MERLVREQMVRGLEEGVKGEFDMCRGCKMGRSSDIKHPRKDPHQVAGLSKTPEELWSGKVPSIKHLRAYGCKAYVSLEKMKRKGKMGVTKWKEWLSGIEQQVSAIGCGTRLEGRCLM